MMACSNGDECSQKEEDNGYGHDEEDSGYDDNESESEVVGKKLL